MWRKRKEKSLTLKQDLDIIANVNNKFKYGDIVYDKHFQILAVFNKAIGRWIDYSNVCWYGKFYAFNAQVKLHNKCIIKATDKQIRYLNELINKARKEDEVKRKQMVKEKNPYAWKPLPKYQ